MDGHGSNEVAAFVKDSFEKYLKESDGYKERDFQKALTNACKKVDEHLASDKG